MRGWNWTRQAFRSELSAPGCATQSAAVAKSAAKERHKSDKTNRRTFAQAVGRSRSANTIPLASRLERTDHRCNSDRNFAVPLGRTSRMRSKSFAAVEGWRTVIMAVPHRTASDGAAWARGGENQRWTGNNRLKSNRSWPGAATLPSSLPASTVGFGGQGCSGVPQGNHLAVDKFR